MSFWYDIKHKKYASDGRDSWIRSYAEKLVSNLRSETDSTLTAHYSGAVGRHSAASVDCTDGSTVQAALDSEKSDRMLSDASILSELNSKAAELSAAITSEADARSAADTAAAKTAADNLSAKAAELNAAIAQKVDKVTGKALSTNDYTNADKAIVDGVDAALAQKADTSALTEGLAGKVDKVTGKALSTNDYTNADKTIVDGVSSALAKKADKTEVLTKTNTTEFAPTADYQPATKKYVDDNISAAGGGDMLKSVYDMDGDGIVDNAEKLGGQLPSYYATATAVNGKAPTSHASSASTYGVGTSSSYGHLKLANNLTTTSTSGYALNAAQGKALKDLIDAITPTPPTLTSTTADGTAIGADGWTGTGWFCTSANTKYAVASSVVDTSILGFNRFCLKPASDNGEWHNWTPYLDLNGTAYEFFYAPGRGLYEALIPSNTQTAAQIVAAIRWENHPPTKLMYGKITNICGVYCKGCLGYDETSDSTQRYWVKSSDNFRNTGYELTMNDYWAYLGLMSGEYTFTGLDINCLCLLMLEADVSLLGIGDVTDAAEVVQVVMGTSTSLTVQTIDNF